MHRQPLALEALKSPGGLYLGKEFPREGEEETKNEREKNIRKDVLVPEIFFTLYELSERINKRSI